MADERKGGVTVQLMGRVHVYRWICAFLLCAASLFCLCGSGSAEAADFGEQWEYFEGESAGSVKDDRAWLKDHLGHEGWKPFSFPHQPTLSRDVRNVWITTVLSPDREGRNTLFFTVVDQSFRIWLNDRVIYEYGDMKPALLGHGWRWHGVVLPELTQDTRLTFQMCGGDPELLGYFQRIELDTEVEQAKNIYMSDFPYLMAFPIAVVLLIIMAAYYVKRIAWSRLCLSVIVFLILFLFWLLSVSNVKFFVLDYPVFWWHALCILDYLLPISLHVIIYEVLERYLKSWMRGIILCYGGLLLLAVMGELAGLHGFVRCLSLYYLLVVFLEPIVFILVLSSASGGNAYSKAMIIPLLGFTALSLIDGFSAHFHVFAWRNFLLSFSIYFFTVFVLGILHEQFAQEKRLFMDASYWKTEREVVTERSSFDALTKCYNRTRLNELLQRGLADSYDNDRPFAMLMFDLDHFKSFNDTFGHEMGDIVLSGFADTVRRCILSNQSFIRWGGEEFVLFCPECPLSSAVILANVIRCRVMLTELCKERQVTCSIGVTVWRGAGDSRETMFERADQALYKAKGNGRNRVEVEL